MTTGGTRVTLRRADEGHLPYVRRLLARNGLPTADLGDGSARFYVGYAGAGDALEADGDERNDPACVAGLERHGTDGLLRSVVVERAARGQGVGTALCDAVEDRAAADGVETLYLLTTTAAGFFAGRGYAEVPREDVPPAIRETAEFADLCPASATVMRRSL